MKSILLAAVLVIVALVFAPAAQAQCGYGGGALGFNAGYGSALGFGVDPYLAAQQQAYLAALAQQRAFLGARGGFGFRPL